MDKKQILTFIFLVFILFVFNRVFNKYFVNETVSVNTQTLVNKEHVSSQALFNKVWKTVNKDFYDSTMNHQDWSYWKHRYAGKIKNDDDAKVAIDTILESLNDPYSRYLPQKAYAEQNVSIDSKISGIGINIISDSGKIKVFSVIEGTPAHIAQLKPNDIIISVDGIDVRGKSISDVATLVRGPENSIVEVTVLRNKTKITKKIKRKEIKIKTIKSSMLDDIGYIQIMSFIGSSAPSEFIQALENTAQAKGLILDLRGNTGGLLTNAVFIANIFIKKGTIVSIVGRNGYRSNIKAQNSYLNINKPIVVLIDGASASASEILSGALKDYKIAQLVGTKTYGKGMVQRIIPLPNETGLNLTIAKYLTPNGSDINKLGIEPDVKIDYPEDFNPTDNDIQLETAKALINKLIAHK